MIGQPINLYDHIVVGAWLDPNRADFSMFKASIIVATGSFGKGRCDHIFKNRRPNFGWIAWKAVDHVHEFRRMPTNNMGRRYYI